jgi:nucleoid-associated protein YgaU
MQTTAKKRTQQRGWETMNANSIDGENVFAAETQDRHEDADLPRDFDRKPPASTRCWPIGAALAVTLLATALHPFSPGDIRDVSEPAAPASGVPPRSANPNARTHVVEPGDTLWDIAKKYVGDPFRYPELTELSNIRNPNLIYPGDIVRIEIREIRK